MPGYAEYSNYPAMLYALTSPSTLGPFAAGTRFQERAWITDFDQWYLTSPPNTVSTFENFGTYYGAEFQSSVPDSLVNPNPSIQRPASGKNDFTFFRVAISFPGTQDKIFIDQFRAKDGSGSSNPPNGNGTKDLDGTIMSIEVTVQPVPPGGSGGGG